MKPLFSALLAALLVGCGGGGSTEPPTAIDLGEGHSHVLLQATFTPDRTCRAVVTGSFWSRTNAAPIAWTFGFYGTRLVVRSDGQQTSGPIATLTPTADWQQLSAVVDTTQGNTLTIELVGIAPPGARTEWGAPDIAATCNP